MRVTSERPALSPAGSILWDARLPFAVVAGGVKDAENDDGIVAADEEDAVGKPIGQHPSHLGPPAQAREAERVLGGPGDRGFDLGQERVAQAGLTVVIPDGGVGDVHLGLDANDDAIGLLRH